MYGKRAGNTKHQANDSITKKRQPPQQDDLLLNSSKPATLKQSTTQSAPHTRKAATARLRTRAAAPVTSKPQQQRTQRAPFEHKKYVMTVIVNIHLDAFLRNLFCSSRCCKTAGASAEQKARRPVSVSPCAWTSPFLRKNLCRNLHSYRTMQI